MVARNSVVVGSVVVGRPGGGYDDGRHYDRRDWDDDDDDFLEFVGKTAAVTAGVSAISAAIGSIIKDKPKDCQPAVSGGPQYLLRNGVCYEPVQCYEAIQYCEPVQAGYEGGPRPAERGAIGLQIGSRRCRPQAHTRR
ncbi:MAG: hypothetical protein NZM40_01580 [Sphingomonadaceae bacterium]|uniref:hypothetical protein n=1 Tax=Thermaurantiacus sp. TaxID=2820283 RepID=UPI00298ED434|nr:hypothetical protein [Thermaurantiacus sp.]MCS6986131.1 hypothetical protein [Sphingomonadaceae bacterium]MDW8414644.1 hypothetical protein [Thermaurantiacus sp.]